MYIYQSQNLPFKWGLILSYVALAKPSYNHTLILLFSLLIICCVGMDNPLQLGEPAHQGLAGQQKSVIRALSFLPPGSLPCSGSRKKEQSTINLAQLQERSSHTSAAMASYRDLGMYDSPEQWTGNGNPLLLCSLSWVWDVLSPEGLRPLKHLSRAAARDWRNSGLLLAGILQFACKYPWYTSTPQYYWALFAWEVDWKGMWFHWDFLL